MTLLQPVVETQKRASELILARRQGYVIVFCPLWNVTSNDFEAEQTTRVQIYAFRPNKLKVLI